MPGKQEINRNWVDPRVTSFDTFTQTVHHKSGSSLHFALSFKTTYTV